MIKTLFIISIVLSFISCDQNFTAAEKEALKDSSQDAVLEMNKKEVTKPKINNAIYNKPLCDLLSIAIIKKILPDAEDIDFKTLKQKTPECEINFRSGKMIANNKAPAGIIIKGFIPRKGETARTFLQRQIDTNVSSSKIDDLGDEAYVFPFKNNTSIVVIKDDLSYYLRLYRYDDNNQEQAIELMRALLSNL